MSYQEADVRFRLEHNYIPPSEFVSKMSELSPKSDLEFMQICENAANLLAKEAENKSTFYILIECLLQAPKSCRKYIFSKLISTEINAKHGCNITVFICEEFRHQLKEHSIFNTGFCMYTLKFLWTYIDCCKDPKMCQEFAKDTTSLFVYLLDISSDVISKGCVENTREFHNILDQIFTVVLATLCKTREFPPESALQLTVVTDLALIRTINVIKYQSASKCCLMLARCLEKTPAEERHFLRCPESPLLDFFLTNAVQLKTHLFQLRFSTEKQMILLMTSIVNTAPLKTLKNVQLERDTVIHVIFDRLIKSAIQFTTDPDVIVLVARTLKEMIANIAITNNCPSRFQISLQYALSHLDHFVESVSHSARDFLLGLMNSAVNISKNGDDSCLSFFWITVGSLPIHSGIRLAAVAIATAQGDWCHFYYVRLAETRDYLAELLTVDRLRDECVKVYVRLTRRLAEIYMHKEPKILSDWLKPVVDLMADPKLNDSSHCQNIIMTAVELQPSLFDTLNAERQMKTDVHDALLLKYVHFVRTKGVALQTDVNNEELWRGLIKKDRLKRMLVDKNEQIRLAVLQVIVDCQKSTDEFLPFDFDLLLLYLHYNITSQSPSFRNKTLSLYRKMVRRFEGSRGRHVISETSPATLDAYRQFLRRLLRQLLDNLTPDSNFGRRCVSLELLLTVRHLVDDWVNHFYSDDVTNLWSLLFDTYECNRTMTVDVMSSLTSQQVALQDENEVNKFIEECIALACDVRPLKNMAAVCHLQLLVKMSTVSSSFMDGMIAETKNVRDVLLSRLLEKLTELSKCDSSKPVHGLLRCCRALLQTRETAPCSDVFQDFLSKLYDLCMSVKKVAMPVVCNTSPEGQGDDCHLSGRVTSQSQLLLVVAWTTMKEIMFLLAEIARWGCDVTSRVVAIGNCFVEIFLRTRHRGVFEQAYGAFSAICQICYESNEENLRVLPKKWLEYAVGLTTGQIADDDLCNTRRSAGLPFFIMSTLSVLPADSYTTTVTQLSSSVNDDSSALVRSLNTLRALFNNGRMVDAMTSHTTCGFTFALSHLIADIWAVRNAATLLYATLLLRTFHRNNRITLTVLRTRHPGLIELLLKVLSDDCQKSDSLRLYAVLMALDRVHASHGDEVTVSDACAASSACKVRELSAKVEVSLSVVVKLTEIMEKITKTKRDNELHGLFLQLQETLKSGKIQDELPSEGFVRKTLYILEDCGKKFSHFTVTLYIEVLIMLINFDNFTDMELLRRIIRLLFAIKASNLNTARSTLHWARFKLITTIILNKFEHTSDTINFIVRQLVTSCKSTDNYLRRNCLHFLILLNDDYGNHPLILAGDLEMTANVKDFVDSFDSDTREDLLAISSDYIVNFLAEEIRQKRGEDFVLILVLLKYYVKHFAKQTRPTIMSDFVEFDPQMSAAIVSVISECWQNDRSVTDDVKLTRSLEKCASPNAETCLRLAAAEFISQLHNQKDSISFDFCNIFMVLLEDEDERVRTMAAENTRVLPSKLRSCLMSQIMTDSLEFNRKLSFFLGWALRQLPELSESDDVVFEGGESNLYAEILPLAKESLKYIKTLIFSEEKDLVGGVVKLMEVLSRSSLPTVNERTKLVTVEALQMSLDFIQSNGGLTSEFRDFFTTNMLEYLKENLGKNYYSARHFFKELFEPFLK